MNIYLHFDGLMQERHNPSVLAMELHHSYINPSKCKQKSIILQKVIDLITFLKSVMRHIFQVITTIDIFIIQLADNQQREARHQVVWL